MIVALVGLGAAIGAVLRYVVDQLVQSTNELVFPLGTLTINVTGSFALGVLTGLALHHGLHSNVVAVLGAGLLGGYTTFSTWGWESVALVGDRALLEGFTNVASSLALGALAAGAGLGLMSL